MDSNDAILLLAKSIKLCMLTCKIEIKIVPKLKMYCENQHCLVCRKHSVNGSYHNCELIAMLKTYAVLNTGPQCSQAQCQKNFVSLLIFIDF